MWIPQRGEGMENGNDLISRRAAIDALRMDIDIIPFAKAREYARAAIETIHNRLEELPSVQPQRKTGKWIERKHGYWSFVNDKGERDGWIPSYECSECRSGGWRNPEVMNFCPSCGADMRGEQDE